MKLGIMQPYFFPYLGHFCLIAHTDAWVVFDITQYTPKAWMNRNRVLHPTEGWNYITVPLSNGSISIKTYQAKILDFLKAKERILGKLDHYKRRAPYFNAVQSLVYETFSDVSNDSLVYLNVRGLRIVSDYLGIPFNYQICSELDLLLPAIRHPGQWALEISTVLGATDYVNPIGGRQIFDPAEFSSRGINLHFLESPTFEYETRPYKFEPHLSILDVLMWNDPRTVRHLILDKTKLQKAT